MGKELEIKILNIDVDVVTKRLCDLGAVFVFDVMQKIYTYDFINISSEYCSIRNDLRCRGSEKIINHGIKRMQQLCFDVDDLINEFDLDGVQRGVIKNIFGVEKLFDVATQLSINNETLIEKFVSSEIAEIFQSYHINPNKWIRLRQTGDKTTLTIKHIMGRYTDENGVRHHDANNVLEYEVIVSNFDEMKKNLELLGYYHKNYQEKRRIQYRFNDIEVDIDIWPHIPAYMEIEALDMEQIISLVDLLEISQDEMVSMNTDDVYTKYGLNMYDYKELKF